jgi:regulation of enolase protein 1 (concanavalin A-like superfamily)
MTVFMALTLSVITVAENKQEQSQGKSDEPIMFGSVSPSMSDSSSGFTSGSSIPEANLQIPDELQACAERLRRIYTALKKYEKEKDRMPDWLSDLVPDYLSADMLIWPEDGPQSTPLAPDRHLPCSFGYQYSSSMTLPQDEMSYREFKDEERKVWGDAVPLVRYYIGQKCLNISFDGRVYMSETAWETEVKPQEGASEILILKEFFVPTTPISYKKTGVVAEPQSVAGQRSKYRIPEQNLDIPDTLKPCAERLRRIYTALKKYESEKNRMPDWLSDLVPGYLKAETLFCPDDRSHKSSYWPDPELPCSYCYELNPTELGSRPPLDKTMLHYKTLQRGLFGDVVPIVRCFHHGRVLNLAWDGRIYTSPIWFEKLFIPNYSHRMLLEVSPAKPAAPRGRTETLVVPESKILAFDDFDGKLGLKWDILNADLSNFSLTGKPGALTITTQDGHFKEANGNYKNIFLIDTPVAEGQDFQVTTCLSDFRPLEAYNQAGLICWDDEDNYLEWVYQLMKRRGLNFNAGVEANGPTRYTYIPAEGPYDKLWLRITKRGKSYECSSSLNGKSFTVRAVENWGDGSPKQIGLFAINGSLTHPPCVDVTFEFFEVAAVIPKPTAVAVATKPAAVHTGPQKFAIPQANLEIPEEMKPCSENLQKIHEALEQYKKDKSELPGFLSDLVPDYLAKEALLCPTHPSERPPLIPDPKLPCSYGYQYSTAPFSSSGGTTQRQWKDAQRRICGDIVPLVRCYGHDQCLNLSFGGRMYISSLVWERDLDPEGGALRQSASPSQSGTTQSSTTPVQRGEGGVSFEEDLEAFFREMDNTYPFFDLKGIRNDWDHTKKELRRQIKACQSDEQFLEIATKAVLCLHDSHMWFRNTKAALPQWPPKYYPGISFMPAAEGRVVIMIGREELNPNLKAGTIVVKIDGQDARRYLEDRAKARWDEGGISGPQRARLFAYRIPIRSENKGQKHTLTLIVEGKQVDIELTSDFEARGWPHWYNRPENLKQVGSCAYTKLPSGIGYIYLRRVDGTTGPGMKEAFVTYDDAKGWIIDLRGNGGGGYNQALYEVLKALPQPLAVIIDAGCTSAGETMARDLVNRGNARLFGSKTAGSSSAKRIWNFPSGIASLSIPTRSRWGIGGRQIEFNGIEPDVEVEAVPEEVAKDLNSEILRAEEYLAKVVSAETQ